MRRRSLVYLGTPELAVPPLRALVDAGHDVRLVVTRPDRRRGRGPGTSPSPVKAEAQRLGLPVAHSVEASLDAHASLGVVVAYGRIVPEAVLDQLPMVNVHFSLLPRWRGAAPVERAILAGDEVTGVSLMRLEPTLDTGPVYVAEPVVIEPGEHLGPLRRRLVGVGARLLVDLLAGDLTEPQPQQGEAVYAEKLDPSELELRWERPADELARLVRLDRAFTSWRGRRLRVLDAEAVDAVAVTGEVIVNKGAHEASGSVPPPTDAAVHDLPPGTLAGEAVMAGSGALRLLRVQPEGRSEMSASEWVRGARPRQGERLGANGVVPSHS